MDKHHNLAVVVFTDIVGYTSMMEKNEAETLNIIDKNREIQKQIISQYKGTFVKEMGDGLLAVFYIISDAVSASVEIQKICKINSISIRIGIDQGEIWFENNDVFGKVVNIAARIIAKAPPGGIIITDSVNRNIVNKGFRTYFYLEAKLKNVADLQRLYILKIYNNRKFTWPRITWTKVLISVIFSIIIIRVLVPLLSKKYEPKSVRVYTSAAEGMFPYDTTIWESEVGLNLRSEYIGNPISTDEIGQNIILKYLAKKNLDADRTASGMYYKIINKGKGKYLSNDAKISFHLKCYSLSGREYPEEFLYSSTYENNKPIKTTVGDLPSGFIEAVKMIKPQGKIKIFLTINFLKIKPKRPPLSSPNLTYMDIENDEAFMYEVELL